MLSQRPATKPRSANARDAAPGFCSSGGEERLDAAQQARAPATQPTAPKLRRMLTASASAPNIGPRIAPNTAAPKAVPISSPRRARGVSTVSHASAPAQVTVLDAPWTKRASPSAHGPSAAANAKLAQARRARPTTTASFGPKRAAARPPGTPPSSGTGSEGADEQAGAGLREAELVRVARHERRERAEQHRVDEDHGADENEKAAHAQNVPTGQWRTQRPPQADAIGDVKRRAMAHPAAAEGGRLQGC